MYGQSEKNKQRGGSMVTEVNNAKLLQQTPRRCPSSTFWLVVRHEERQIEVLMVGCGGEQALPVFSGDGEAEMFVWLAGAFEDGWRVRETSAGELVSILYGPCAGVGRVALDPSPEMVGINAVSLVSVTRERFLSWILDSSCSSSLGARAHDHPRRLVRSL
jgi:hypothetical protein